MNRDLILGYVHLGKVFHWFHEQTWPKTWRSERSPKIGKNANIPTFVVRNSFHDVEKKYYSVDAITIYNFAKGIVLIRVVDRKTKKCKDSRNLPIFSISSDRRGEKIFRRPRVASDRRNTSQSKMDMHQFLGGDAHQTSGEATQSRPFGDTRPTRPTNLHTNQLWSVAQRSSQPVQHKPCDLNWTATRNC